MAILFPGPQATGVISAAVASQVSNLRVWRRFEAVINLRNGFHFLGRRNGIKQSQIHGVNKHRNKFFKNGCPFRISPK